MSEIKIASGLRLIAVAGMWGVIVLLISLGTQWLLYRSDMHLPGSIIAASVTAIWTFRLEQLNRQRQQAHLRRFQLISDMNHHIRNALQVISYHAFLQDGYTEHEHIRDAMNRIEWVLQEVLPQVNDAPQPAKQLVGRVEYRAS